MQNRTQEQTLRSIARLTGVFYLIIFIAGIFAQVFVRGALIAPGDASLTASNIMASEGLFRVGIVSDMFMVLSDVVVGLLFYVLLRHVNHALALLAAFFRLAQAVTLGVNLLNLMVVTRLLGGADYLSAFSADQLNAQALFYLDAHATGYRIALVFFAFSILILGYLMMRSRAFPRILGVLLIIAAVGYMTDSFADFLLPNYADYVDLMTYIVFIPAVIGELALILWLLVRGVRNVQTEDALSINAPQAEGLPA